MSDPCACYCHVSVSASCNVDSGYGVGCGPHEEVPLEEACVMTHPENVARYVGLTCRRHYHWIDRTLVQILELFALLPDVILPGPASGERHGTVDGSPAPGRIDVMVLTDTRNIAMPERMTPYLNSDSAGRLTPNGFDDIPDWRGILASWVRLVIEESDRQPTGDSVTVTGAVRYLRRERHWIANQAWVDDYADELGDLHRTLARAAGATMWPLSIGKCPNCQIPLYNTVGVDEVTCRKCRTVWTGVNLARLRLIHEQEGARA